MKNSCFISILLMLLVAGCVSIKPKDVVRRMEDGGRGTGDGGRGTGDGGRGTGDVMRRASRVTKFTPPLNSYLFKATLDVKKHHLTGLLVIKRMDTLPPAPPKGNTSPPAPPQKGLGEISPVYRVVFVNEVGMTFFDVEIAPDSFRVVSCFESLNKKALMKIIETDIRVLTREGTLKNESFYRQSGTNGLVVSGKSGKYKSWQTFSPSGDTLWVTAAKSTIADPVVITYDQYKDGFPLKISIENPFIGMKLVLRKLTQ